MRRWEEFTGKQATREADGWLVLIRRPAMRLDDLGESRSPSGMGMSGRAGCRSACCWSGGQSSSPSTKPWVAGCVLIASAGGLDRLQGAVVKARSGRRRQSGVRGGCRGRPDRFEGLAGGVRDGGHRQGQAARRARSSCPKAPGFVLGGGMGWWCSSSGSLGLIVATPVVTRCSIEKPSAAWPLSRSF